jgi:hypothetical protein
LANVGDYCAGWILTAKFSVLAEKAGNMYFLAEKFSTPYAGITFLKNDK